LSQLNIVSRPSLAVAGEDDYAPLTKRNLSKKSASWAFHKSFGVRLVCLSLLVLSLCLQIGLQASAVLAADGLAVGAQVRITGTDGDGVRLRIAPSATAATRTTLKENWLVTVQGGPFGDSQGNSFYKVEWAGQSGYAMTQYLTFAGRSGVSLSAGTQARVNGTDGDGVRMRTAPSLNAGAITTLGEDWQVSVLAGPISDSSGHNFYKVQWANQQGYALASYLTFAGRSSTSTSSNANSSGGRLLAVGGQVKVSGTGGDGVRMRQQPNAASPVINILPETYLVSVLGGPFNDAAGNTFYRVEWAGQTGYITSTYLTPASSKAVAGTGGWMRITNTDGDPVRFRDAPDTNGSNLGVVYEGEALKILAGPFMDNAGRHWYKLDHSGTVGYVDATYLSRSNSSAGVVVNIPAKATAVPAPKAVPVAAPAIPAPVNNFAPPSNGSVGQRIADYSRQFLGYRYVWGGSSPAAGGFDCSGLVHYVLAQVGIDSGHNVDSDLAIGSAVSLNNLQPGDILIFVNTYKAGPSHSGIYIGGGRFIHAESESTGVTISSLSEGYYASRIYAARRP